MNFTPFNDLAKQSLRYMNPENDWRFIHADSYVMYNLMPNIRYTSSFPVWAELQDELFDEIRTHVNMPNALISNLVLVKASKNTICHPIKRWSGIVMLEGDAYAAIYNGKYDFSKRIALRAMGMHSPHLNHWHNYDAFGFNVDTSKVLFPGGRCTSFFPKEGATFFYFNIDDAWIERQGIRDKNEDE